MSEIRLDLMTPGEVATAFRVDPKTVNRWAQEGKLASIRTPGRHRRYVAFQVKAMLTGRDLTHEEVAALDELARRHK